MSGETTPYLQRRGSVQNHKSIIDEDHMILEEPLERFSTNDLDGDERIEFAERMVKGIYKVQPLGEPSSQIII